MIGLPGKPGLSPASWVTVQTVYTQGFGVAVFALQAPLLGPRAFGLVAIVMVFIGFCEALLDQGTEVLVSVREIEPAHYATMNAVTGLLGLALGVVLLLASGPLASSFHEPQLASVAKAMAILPLLAGIGCAPNAQTRRAMEFKPLAIRMISGVTAGGVVGVALTLLGAGVWALVWQAILQRFIGAFVLWINSPLAFQVRLSRSHWRDLSLFVWPLLVSRIMTWLSSQLPRFILALHLTVAELGLFSLAARLSDILVQVAVVPKAAVARVDLRRFTAGSAGLIDAVSRMLLTMSILCFGLCAVGAVLVPTLFRVWLDPKWSGAIVPSEVLILSAGAWVSFYGSGVLFLALNQQRREALMSVVQSSTILLTAWFFSRWGLVDASVAMAIRPLLLIPLAVFLVKTYAHVPIRAFLGAQGPALAGALASGGLVWMLRTPAENAFGNGIALLVLGAVGMLTYVLVLSLLAPDNVRRLVLQRAGINRE